MSHRRPLIRRTFLQERYEILIKRQKEGTATFNELTELDEIVNRDPTIREIVMIENHFIPGADDSNDATTGTGPVNEIIKHKEQPDLLARLKAYLGRIFMMPASPLKEKAVIYI